MFMWFRSFIRREQAAYCDCGVTVTDVILGVKRSFREIQSRAVIQEDIHGV
jgi:hypothetical protein